MRKLIFVFLALIVALCSVVVTLLTNPTLADGPTITEFPICTDPAEQWDPAISGDIVVWMDNRNGNYDIYGYDLSTDTEFPICIHSASQYDPIISGDIVVWTDRRSGNEDIYGYNLSAGTEFAICTHTAVQTCPAISGDIVAWTDRRSGNYDIYGYNLSAGIEFPICTNPDSQYEPAISGDIVVWHDYRNGNYDIYGYNLSTSTEFPICTEPGEQWLADVSADVVAWTDRRSGNEDIYGYNLSAGIEFPICTAPGDQVWPAISGDIVVWDDGRSSPPVDIYGYDLSTGTEFPICTAPGNQQCTAISADTVVWADNRNGDYDIYGARLGLAQLNVCIDPGHGGTDPGAVGWDGDAYPNEKDFTLDIAVRLRDLLEGEGIEVVMTREADIDVGLQTRCDIANNNGCDIFVSIHCNSGVPSAHGTETFYYDHLDIPNPEVGQAGYGLAYNIQKGLVAEIGLTDRRTEGDLGYFGYHLYVLSHTDMPATLTEVAFISNPTEFGLLSDPSLRQSAAHGIANGILQYFEQSAFTITAHSPVDIVVNDPDGLTISKELNEIPGATYTETDIDGDGDLDNQVRIPDRKIGDYTITVIREPDALPSDTYTLEVSIFGTPIVLADDVQIRDIPSEPYIVESTSTGIVPPWIYIFTDPDIGTELRINTDNKTFQFIAPGKDFGVREAPRMMVRDTTWGQILHILYRDSEIRLSAFAIDGERDYCRATVRDLETRERYRLVDRRGIE